MAKKAKRTRKAPVKKTPSVEALTSHAQAVVRSQVNQIWAYVRNNKHSLESERACRMIRELVETASQKIQDKIDPVVKDNEKLTATISDLRKQLRESKKEISEMNELLLDQSTEIEKLSGELDLMVSTQDDLVDSNADEENDDGEGQDNEASD